MKKFLLALAGLAMVVVGLFSATPAEAATYYWNNTVVGISGSAVTVAWCSGGTASLRPGPTTTKNVCGVWVPYGSLVDANVRETGTNLVYTAYCGTGNGKWVYFTSRTDTSRTAVVTRTRANCA